MSRNLRLAYFAHSLRSDWNNGNAHFLRGLLDNLRLLGHDVACWEPEHEWSIDNLCAEPQGEASLAQFAQLYPDLNIQLYPADQTSSSPYWRTALRNTEVVILHEWNPPALAHTLLGLRDDLGFKLLFHDTHHRASSSPESIHALGVDRFDGILAYGESLRSVYRDRFGLHRVWTLHEAADTRIFKPTSDAPKLQDVVWIGNWGDDERTSEINEFLLEPAKALPEHGFTIYGVRYPDDGLRALRDAGVHYGGYLPNLAAPGVYAGSSLSVHIPRRQYVDAMRGIPTIRVFEALACGIPLLSAPWEDTEHLFRADDLLFVRSGQDMQAAIERLLEHPEEAAAQAARGRETVLAHHTCRHRAEQVTSILEEDVVP